MSTSAPTGDKAAEPNLTPLLDMVLQLVMFFMLCANFVVEQSSKSIALPEALAARALDKSTQNFLMLNVDAKGSVQVGGGEKFVTAAVSTQFFRNQFDADKSRAKPADWDAGRGRSVIIIRADKNCTYKQVDDVMAVCRKAGYQDVRLRTLKAVPR